MFRLAIQDLAFLGLFAFALAVLSCGPAYAQSAGNTQPMFAAPALVRTVPENSPPGTNVGDPVETTDANHGIVSYSLSGIGADLFEIDATGQITVGDGTDLDYESSTSYTVTVNATGISGAKAAITVTVLLIDMTLGTSYDRDNNEVISGDEVLEAVSDYFTGVIDGDDVLGVIRHYFLPAPVKSAGHLYWNFETDSAVRSSPETSNGVVYVATEGGYLYAIDASSGRQMWRFHVGVLLSSPKVADGVVYVGSWDTHMYAVDSATGLLLWRYETGGEVNSSPTVEDGTVYFGSDDGYVYALDAATGALLWRYGTSGQVQSSPALSDGVAFVGSTDGNLYALDASTGNLVWLHKPEGNVFSSPTVAEGVVYVISTGGISPQNRINSLDGVRSLGGTRSSVSFDFPDDNLLALDAATGNLIWSFEVGPWTFSPPIVADGTVYILSSGDVYALSAQTGELSWRYAVGDLFLYSGTASDGVLYVSGLLGGFTHALDASDGLRLHSYNGGGSGASTVSDGMIYIGSVGGVSAYGTVTTPPEGVPPWRFQTGGEVRYSPGVVDGVAYVPSGDGNVYALDAWTGHLLWQREIIADPGHIGLLPPIVVGGVVYIESRNGLLYALESSTGNLLWQFEADSAFDYFQPIVVGEVAYVVSHSGTVYALEASAGDLVWKHRIDPYDSSSTISYMGVDGGVVYISLFTYSSFGPSSVTALDASSGSLVWQYESAASSRVLTLATAGSVVYAGTGDGHVYALRASDGELVWQLEVPWSNDIERQEFYSLSVDSGVVYAVSHKGSVYALDASSGNTLWQYESGGKIYARPEVIGDVVYVDVLSDYDSPLSYLHALQASTGNLLWRYEVGDRHFSSFVSEEDETVYIGSDDGSVSALHSSNGKRFWRYEFGYVDPRFQSFPSRAATFPRVVDGVIYVGSQDGSVYALDIGVMAVLPDRQPLSP